MKKMEHFLELLMFNSRWLLAPFYVALVIAIALLLVKFTQEFFHTVGAIFTSTHSEFVLAVLTLVDMVLVANLLLIIIFSGYENFVSKIHTEENEDRPGWMGKVDFSGLKQKLIASIVAISAIEMLKAFVKVDELSADKLSWSGPLGWKVAIHIVLVISGLVFALTDRVSGHANGHNGNGSPPPSGGHS